MGPKSGMTFTFLFLFPSLILSDFSRYYTHKTFSSLSEQIFQKKLKIFRPINVRIQLAPHAPSIAVVVALQTGASCGDRKVCM
ncbi:hypothetical protein FPQ18DRAFT_352690 [Pyronema domesticum]|nr:hypothetical protein FPQ18DRAFT_352690 [Pyronema domesticum]